MCLYARLEAVMLLRLRWTPTEMSVVNNMRTVIRASHKVHEVKT